MPWEPVLIVAALIVFVGYVIFGVTGFGASPITIPVLAHFLPLTFVLALASLLDLASALVLGFHTRRQADRRELLPFTFLGLALGVTLLVKLPRSIALLALGIFVCLHALHIVLRRGSSRQLSRVWAAPAGVVGGVLGALFGTGGPPYVAYLTGRLRDPGAQRATISQMVILSVGLRVIIFAVAGLLFTRNLWTAVGLLLPVAWIGVWVGHRIQLRVAPAMLARVIALALFVTGASLIVRTL